MSGRLVIFVNLAFAMASRTERPIHATPIFTFLIGFVLIFRNHQPCRSCDLCRHATMNVPSHVGSVSRALAVGTCNHADLFAAYGTVI